MVGRAQQVLVVVGGRWEQWAEALKCRVELSGGWWNNFFEF